MRGRRLSTATFAARAGTPGLRPGGTDLVAPPALSAVSAFSDLEELDSAMEAGQGGYRRFGNPSVHLLQEALAALEGVGQDQPPACRVTASGQSALVLALSTLMSPARRRVILVRPCYGGSESLLAGPLAAFGVELTIVDLPPPGEIGQQLDAVEAALDETVACVVADAIGNPLLGLLDLPRLIACCRRAAVASVVDNTLATPFLLRPLELGADVVVHSLSKQLSGHSDVIGGAVLIRADHPAADRLDSHCRAIGAVMSPFDAFLSLRGLRTAGLRVERGSASAAALADVAGRHPAAPTVHYPGRRSPDEEALAARLLPEGRGSMLALDVGGRDQARCLLAAMPDVRLAPSLGDVATTVSHPGVSSHRHLGADRRRALGIGDGLLRFSVGIEDVDDLTAELETALDAVAATMTGQTSARSAGA